MPLRSKLARLSSMFARSPLRGRPAVAGREVAAFLRQARLLPHDTAPVIPTDARAGDDVVLFLHGLLATAGVLRPLRAAVTRHPGVHAAALTYAPGPGVVEIGERVAALFGELDAAVRIHVVGHSLGGIVARWLVQDRRDPRVVQTISLAAPFAGLPASRLLGVGFARDLDASSPILRRIYLDGCTGAVPHLSIVAADDTLIPTPLKHILPGGEVVVVRGVGHNALLYDPEVVEIVERRIVEAPARTERAPRCTPGRGPATPGA